MYQLLSFGSDANAYIRLQLSMCPTLWQKLCELPLELGRVQAFLPLSVTPRQLMHFAWSLNSREALEDGSVDFSYLLPERETIREYLKGPATRVAVFYGDTLPPEGVRRNYVGPVTTYYNVFSYPNNYSPEVPTRTEVYYVIRAGISDEVLNDALDNRVERMPFMACLTSLPKDSFLSPTAD